MTSKRTCVSSLIFFAVLFLVCYSEEGQMRFHSFGCFAILHMQRGFSLRIFLILSFELTIYKLKLFFECGIPMPQDAGAPSLLQLHICHLYIISIAVLETCPRCRVT
jgi:hypothetical protein